MISFSFKPCNVSTFPLIAASVKTRVVSWKDAADKNDSVSRAALVIPNTNGDATAGRLPANKAFWLLVVKSTTLLCLRLQ